MADASLSMIIDGKTYEFTQGQTILEVATNNEIYIPTLCFLEGVKPFGGCRLCIVRILDSKREFQTACNTRAKNGMEVITIDDELQNMRREILELILSEHPNGCLICAHNETCQDLKKDDHQKSGRVFGCFTCPSNGTCELQDLVNYLDLKEVKYDLEYRNLPIYREDPFFERDYNLCIQCGRCIRVCKELRGLGVIKFADKGYKMMVSTEDNVPLIDTSCMFCGACVDACPTGALTAKSTKWVKKADNMSKSSCGFCSVGCGFNYYTINDELMESVPSTKDQLNNGQGCVIGRFCTPPFFNHMSRLKYPMRRIDATHVPCEWNEIYEEIHSNLAKYKPEEIALIASPDLNNESAYVLEKFGKEILHTPNLTLSTDFIPINESNVYSFSKIPSSKWIMLINTYIPITHPMLMVHLNQAKRNGAKFLSLNVGDVKLPEEFRKLFDAELELGVQEVTSILIAVLGVQNKILLRELGLKIDENLLERKKIKEFIEQSRGKPGSILLGNYMKLPPDYIHDLQKLILNFISNSADKINYLGIWNRSNLIGVSRLITKPLSSIKEKIESGDIKAIYTTERLHDINLDKIEYLIVQDIFASEFTKKANIILPSMTFTESFGHFTNAELIDRKFNESSNVFGSQKPDWKIFSECAKYFDNGEKVQYTKPDEVYNEFIVTMKSLEPTDLNFKNILKLSIPERPDRFTFSRFQYRGQLISPIVPDLQYLIDQRESQKPGEPEESITEKPTDYQVVHIEENIPNIYKIVIKAPLIAAKAQPGNFVLVMRNEKSERIPISFADWDTKEGTITLFFQERGFSTKELSEVQNGGYLYSVVGPLGNPIEIEENKNILIGGGCYGMGALYPVVKAAKAKGCKVYAILEGKSKYQIYLRDEYEELADEVIYVTSDGSLGYRGSEKGKIVTGIEQIIQDKQIDVAYFFGCKMMMMEASKATEKLEIPTYVSLDTIMLDGTGMCGACRLTLIEEGTQITKFACVDGPIFDGHKVDWDELMKRAIQYDHQEVEVYRSDTCRAIYNFNKKKGDSQ